MKKKDLLKRLNKLTKLIAKTEELPPKMLNSVLSSSSTVRTVAEVAVAPLDAFVKAPPVAVTELLKVAAPPSDISSCSATI